MWAEDLYICGPGYDHKVIPDEEGGMILQANPQGDFNNHYRINFNGTILWQKDHLSWYYWAGITLGEPGYFYLGFTYQPGTYGQRVRISDGRNMWPTWGSGQVGALMASYPGCQHGAHESYSYRFPYFYGVFDYNTNFTYPWNLYGQVLDTLGNRIIGENGVLMSQFSDSDHFNYTSAVASDSGIIATFSKIYDYDVYAKRANFDGSLGGPYPPIEGTVITISDSNVVLSWPSQSDSVNYHIYKSSTPYNFPTEPDTTVSDTIFIDIGAVSEGEAFYRVTWEP
jgi:hypothetical protein